MKPKLILCLAIVLSGSFILAHANETNTVAATNSSDTKLFTPHGSVDLPKLGRAIFIEQPSSLTLQVPIGFRKNGEKPSTSNSNTLDLQVWLLKADGTAIPQSDKPSVITLYSTDYMFYEFPKVPANELSGVVVRLNGKLYCHEIEKTESKP